MKLTGCYNIVRDFFWVGGGGGSTQLEPREMSRMDCERLCAV